VNKSYSNQLRYAPCYSEVKATKYQPVSSYKSYIYIVFMRFSLFSASFVTLTLNDLTAFSSCGFCSRLRQDHLECRWGFTSQASSLAATSRVSWSAATALVSTGQSVLVSACGSEQRRASLTAVTNDRSGHDEVRSSAARWHSLPSWFVVAIPINLSAQKRKLYVNSTLNAIPLLYVTFKTLYDHMEMYLCIKS